jgi:hypothetical protein
MQGTPLLCNGNLCILTGVECSATVATFPLRRRNDYLVVVLFVIAMAAAD